MKQWNDLLIGLEKELGSETVNKWLRSLKVLKFDAGNLFLDAADSFQVNWFKEYVSHLLPQKLVMSSGKPIKVHFSIGGKPFDEKKQSKIVEPPSFLQDPLEPHATFEEFLALKNENLPLNLLRELVTLKLPLGSYNPIYVYGPKGSGKSHLLMATTKALEAQGKKCFYIRADTFTDHVIRAFRSGSLQEFRNAARDIEVLIIDDVHLFSRKTATQEELFHTFNRLHTAGLQIILASNVAPQLLEEIEERLVSRFEWGITLPISSPPEELKKVILEKRAMSLALPLTDELKAFLTSCFKDLHLLIQALEALALRLPDAKGPVDLEVAKFYLKDLTEKAHQTVLTPEKILKTVANTFGIKTDDILGKGQSREQALPRQIAMYLCREKLKMPFLKIGSLFTRDHSTVMTSVKRVKKGLEKKEEGFLLPLLDIQKALN